METSSDVYVVEGHVRDENGKPVNNVSIHVVDKDRRGENILGDTRTDKQGYYKLEFPESKFRRTKKEKGGPDLVVSVLEPAGATLGSSPKIGNASKQETVNLTIPFRQEVTYEITGRILSPVSASVGGLQVSIVDKNVNGDVLLAKAVTDDNGMYHVTFTDTDLRKRGKTIADLQARVHAGETVLGASDVHYNASPSRTLNVLLDDRATSRLRSEHEVLTSTLARQFTGSLRDLKETDHQHDITFLANKTGWDARAVAFAALAEQFSARTVDATGTPAIPPPFFYALFRAGLPADEATLYHTNAKTVEAVWKQAVEQNIIPEESADQIPHLVESFQLMSAEKLLTELAPIGASSFKEMMIVSGLSEVQQVTFTQLYATRSTDMPALWNAVSEALGQEVASRLQVDGKLAYLTINNASLMQKVHATISEPISDLLQLAQTGYYRVEAWSQLLTPDVPLPKEIPGETPETQRANYGEYLAAQVRLSYPTASIAHMIKSGILPLMGTAEGVSDQVAAFLTEHQGKFEIGVQPIEQYISANNVKADPETVKQIARVHRVSQITPSDQAMIGLMKRNIDAAYHIVGYDKDTFVQGFAEDLGGADQAAITYDRAVQVHNVVLNVALGYLNAHTAPAIGVHSPTGIVEPMPFNTGDLIAYAKLEQLFGSMDFCTCEHCRSILSPAAYLVDLLQFVDPKAGNWDESLGGILISGPAVCSWEKGRLDVFARGAGDKLIHKWYTSARGWEPSDHWENLGDGLTSDPAAVSWGENRIDVFARRTDGALWHKWYEWDKWWSGWESLGGVLTSGPAVCSWGKGRLDVFARGEDDRLIYKWYDRTWSDWEALDRSLTSNPAAVSWGNGRIDVFARGIDNGMWHKWYDNGRWTSMKPYDVLIERRPDVVNVPLTCENTNTALPYIDIVNETLEYFIANTNQKLSLNDYQGHDTNGIASDDLLANPQYVMDSAYTTLAKEYFPASLPFHQPLENLRRYFNKFEVPLPLAMERLRKNDVLDVDRTMNPPPPLADYGWRDILIEELGLSRSEYEILTTSHPAEFQLWKIYGYAADTKDTEIIHGNEVTNIARLSNAKTFCRRIGVSYEELVSILKTHFINPNSDLIPKLERLGVSFAVLDALHRTPQAISDGDFNRLLPAGVAAIDVTEFGGDKTVWENANHNYAPIIRSWLEANDNYSNVMGLIILTDVTDTAASLDLCSFDNLEFRYSRPMTSNQDTSTRIGALDFVRLLRFIRLWKKLGWTIEQTDAAISALYPTGAESLDVGFRILVVRFGVLLRVMKALNLGAKRDLLPLLVCWSEISTYGDNALYRQMFLNPSVQKQDAVFADDGYGEFLQDHSQTLFATSSTKKAKVAGTITLTNELSTSINGLMISYKVDDTDTSITTLAEHIVKTINEVTTADPLTGKPLNEVIVASNDSGIITITLKNPTPDSSITLACSVSEGATVTYASLNHESALCAALNLTNAEFSQITDALGYTAETRLTLTTVSAIYRRGWLARKLKLSVRELLLLIQYTGLDPFAVPDITTQSMPPFSAEPAIFRLIALVQALRDRSLKSAAALYLIWNQDLSGKSAPDPAQLGALARTLRLSFADVEAEFAVKDDPDGTLARAKMAQVYGTDATNFLFSLLDGSLVTDVEYSHPQMPLVTSVAYERDPIALVSYVSYKHHQSELEQSIRTVAPQLAYDDLEQRLSYTDALSKETVDAVKNAAGAIADSVSRELFTTAVESLYEENQKVIKANLQQPIVDAAPRLVYNDAQLSFTGSLSETTIKALRDAADRAMTDSDARVLFKSAVDHLYEENQQVIKCNLEQEIVDAAWGRLFYDDFRKRLSFIGALSSRMVETPNVIKAAAEKVISDSDAMKRFAIALDELFSKNQSVVDLFFDRYPELRPLYEAYTFFLLQLHSAVRYSQTQAELDKSIRDAAQGRLTYDANLGEFSYTGVMSGAVADALKQAAEATQTFKDAEERETLKSAVDSLHEANQGAINDFFTTYKTLVSNKDAYLLADNSPARQRSVLLEAILPELKRRRKEQQALLAISTAAQTDLDFARTLLITAPYPIHASEQIDLPAKNDILALEKQGLSVKFFASDTVPEDDRDLIPNVPNIATNLDYRSDKTYSNPLPVNTIAPDAAISGIWDGYLESPDSGFFNLRINADTGAKVTLRLLDDKAKSITLIQDLKDETLWYNGDPIELRAGMLYPIILTIENVRRVVRVQWDWEPKGQGRAVIPARYLYPKVPFEAFENVYVRFLKAASLAAGLGLTASELTYFATDADYYINAVGWLNTLSVSGDPDPATATALLKPFEALLDFARIKAEISPNDESLLSVLQDPTAVTQKKESLLLTLTRWNQTSLNDVLTQFKSNIAGLEQFDLFRRVYDAFALIQKIGISAKVLIQATTNEPTADTVRDLQAALRARYDAADWRDVVRPINDEMRSLQRDALVAYILHQMRSHKDSAHIDTPDKLFEYFLMDVEMDPCMQTSRIRHALSSVQLFIERCLMNLEPRVSPGVFSNDQRKQWEWMKRYRVWEANRKVYLYPENWLEPELRDDKSPFFKEIESELLQSDITAESAEAALLNYLVKLNEVSKLEPCGIHYVEAKPGRNAVLHVVARTTTGAKRKYFYRRQESTWWTPWEEIKLGIEDNPVIPVVWKDRLFLFWLRILKAPIDIDKQAASSGPRTDPSKPDSEKTLTELTLTDLKTTAKTDAQTNTQVNVQAVLCWSEYFQGKWQPVMTSDVSKPLNVKQFATTGVKSFDRSELQLYYVREEEGGLAIHFDIKGTGGWFILYNAHSALHHPEVPSYGIEDSTCDYERSESVTTSGVLKVSYGYGQGAPEHHLLKKKKPPFGSAIGPTISYVAHSADAPFFYADNLHVFCVTTKEKPLPLPDNPDYGHRLRMALIQDTIPPLVFQAAKTFEIKPKPLEDRVLASRDLVISRTPMRDIIMEDGFIQRSLETTTLVKYGDFQMGPAGRLIDLRRTI